MGTLTTASPRPTYPLDINGQRLLPDSPGFEPAIARAYAKRQRPRCLCRPEGIEMYIARLERGYVVKRMPESGHRHAPACPSFEPPAELSGIGPLLGGAIREDPSTGMTMLKLRFSLSKGPGRASPSKAQASAGSVVSSRARLSLRALLHYLWDQAELTRWHPAFEGRRSWGVVRRLLLQAASRMVACGEPLAGKLDVPEPFSVQQQEAINERRHTRWAKATKACDGFQAMLLLIAEVKEITPARHGHKAVIKHIPEVAFAFDDALYHHIGTRFPQELALWSALDSVHMIIAATVNIGPEELPRIAELTLMVVDKHWLPVESMTGKSLVDDLVGARRSFLRLLRYDAGTTTKLPYLALTDRGSTIQLVFADGET